MSNRSPEGTAPARGNRAAKWAFVAALLPLCWWSMMGVHEAGHVLGAWISGGEVAGVRLHPLSISRTDLARNPHPLIVAWAGPIVGAMVPLVAYGAWQAAHVFARRRRPSCGWQLPRFFAGFCLIANGAYLGFGSIDRVGDAGDLMRHGTPTWILWAFGLLTIPAGLWLWHRLEPRFGLGPEGPAVSAAQALVLWLLLAVVLALMWWLSSHTNPHFFRKNHSPPSKVTRAMSMIQASHHVSPSCQRVSTSCTSSGGFA